MKIITLLLCRGGSKGIPRKNIKPLNGKPLMAYAIDEAKKLKYPVYVSTEDEEIKQVALSLEVNVIDRPAKLAQDDSKSIDAVKHALRVLKESEEPIDYVVLLNACTPFVKAEDIQACVDIARKTKCDSVVSLIEDFSSHPSKLCNLIEDRVYPISSAHSFETGERQALSKIYKRNTSIYIASRQTIRKGTFFGKNTRGYVMPPERSIDINTPYDFWLCDLIMKNK